MRTGKQASYCIVFLILNIACMSDLSHIVVRRWRLRRLSPSIMGTRHPELGTAVTMTAPDGDSATLQHHAAIMLILQSPHCRIHARCNIGIDEVVIDKPNLIQIQMKNLLHHH